MRGPVDFTALRLEMVKNQLFYRGIRNGRVLSAFRDVPRELFVPEAEKGYAYEDHPLPIGMEQTISQPYIVALMTELLDIREGEKVLEIGTGSGYQAAILAYLGAQVYSIERVGALARKAGSALKSLDYNVKIKLGDGTLGWDGFSPYDRIIVTAASCDVPHPLIEQLKVGGKMIIPLGGRWHQELTIVIKISSAKIETERSCGCIFVPLIGKYGYKE